MRVFGEWTWSPASDPLVPKKPSRLDQYLSACDEQETAVVLTADENEWLQKLGWLEASIKLQSWQS
jgi:hypothetical protein